MRPLLICLALAALPLSALDAERIETGYFRMKSGAKVIAIYCVINGQYRAVDLIWPDGQETKIAIVEGTARETMDNSLQRLVNAQ